MTHQDPNKKYKEMSNNGENHMKIAIDYALDAKTPLLEELLAEFDKFIKKWCPSWKHLIDCDENDGQRYRERLEDTFERIKEEGRREGWNSFGKEADAYQCVVCNLYEPNENNLCYCEVCFENHHNDCAGQQSEDWSGEDGFSVCKNCLP